MLPGTVRYTLWASVPFNLAAAYIILFPSSVLGRLVGLPPSPPLVYAALLALLIALFGLVYGALAMRPTIDRPSLGFAAAGKLSVFLTVLGLWLGGQASGGLLVLTSGDLAFGMLWGWWLVSTA